MQPTVGPFRAQKPASSHMLVSKNQRKQQYIGRLQTTIDNLKAKIQDKDDIIFGLRCKLASSSAGHASPVLLDVPS
eukprot:2537066-Karenia_brevis.AAC.1